MFRFPGEDTEILLEDNKPVRHFGYPDLGSICRVRVLRTTLLFGHVEIFEINGLPTIIPYLGLIKQQDITTNEYISDTMKVGDVFECTVVSYGDLGIYLVRN